jgi:hypothetical protein
MNVAAMHNEPDLAKMSASAPPPEHEPRGVEGEAEVDYLSREIADSKAALLRTSEELRDNLCTTADLSRWVRRYPWAALGVATVAGFSLASVVTPQRGESLSDKLSTLAGNRPPGNGPQEEAASPRPAKVTAGPSVSQSFIESLFGLARILVETLVMAAVREAQRQPTVDRPVADDRPAADDRPSQ